MMLMPGTSRGSLGGGTGGNLLNGTAHPTVWPSFGSGQGNAPSPVPTTLPPSPTPHIETQPGSPAPAPAPAPSGSPANGNLLAGFTATMDSSSPTGGTVNPINPSVNPSNIASGINTSASGLLPGGFSQSQLGVTAPPVAPPAASSYVTAAQGQMAGPVQWNVTAPQTVAGQYQALMQNGGANTAINAAEQSVLQQHAANGGQNDLMAQTAATQAGSQVALQIASQDAATNAAAGQYNATAANNYNQALNQFVQNAQLSRQNFDQGVSMLNAQTGQQLSLLTANVNANAANASVGLKASLDTVQANLNATLAQMNQNFAQTSATNLQAYGINSAEAIQNYGMQVQLGYLQGVNQQMTALTNEIANISANPNITSAQAQGAMSDAINQFNTFMTQLSSYSSSMMPSSTTAAENGTYSTPAFNYSYVNGSTWPMPSTNGGGQSATPF